MKVAILGANGQLGADVAAAFRTQGDEVIALTHEDVEVSSLKSVKDCLESAQPEVVSHTAAFHNVERCEDEPLPAFTVNAIGARNVAQITASRNSKLLHISTDHASHGMKSSPSTDDD